MEKGTITGACGICCSECPGYLATQANDAEKIAEVACALAQEFVDGDHSCPWRYYAECLVCLDGGARHVVPSSLPLDLQLMVPTQCLVLVLSPDTQAPARRRVCTAPR